MHAYGALEICFGLAVVRLGAEVVREGEEGRAEEGVFLRPEGAVLGVRRRRGVPAAADNRCLNLRRGLTPERPPTQSTKRKREKMQYVLQNKVFPEIGAWADELAAFRRDVHAHPELGFDTARTVGRIVETLRGWGITNVDADVVKGGVVVVIDGARPGATVALRADIDALPMPDQSKNPWRSTVEMRCHACGHDGHTTWLLGALRYLHEKRGEWAGRVVGVFQPAEEIGRGARAVVDAGVIEKYDVKEIYGAHDEPALPKGVFGLRAGPAQASTDFFYITLTGRGVHAARVHLGIDPVPAAGLLICALQTVVSRKVSAIEPAVLSISSVNAGHFHTPNVIPEEATLSGTVRTFSESVRCQIEAEMARMVKTIAESEGCRGDFRYDRLTPALINSADAVEHVRGFVTRRFGAQAAAPIDVSMGGEDFAEYLFKVPGAMIRVGIRDEVHQAALHHPTFDFNDEVIPAAATMLAGVALERLAALA